MTFSTLTNQISMPHSFQVDSKHCEIICAEMFAFSHSSYLERTLCQLDKYHDAVANSIYHRTNFEPLSIPKRLTAEQR